MVRFLHTADWQLGMAARFLDDEAAVRFSGARLKAVQALGKVAAERDCAFVLVCGDLFDSNFVSRRTVNQVVQELSDIPVPVYILPGNHDALDPSSVYRRDEFRRVVRDHVHVLDEPGTVSVAAGVEIAAAPWYSKRPTEDLVGALCASLEPSPVGTVRILAGHGAVDALTSLGMTPSTIRLRPLKEALSQGKCHYAALGDRHSLTSLDERVWYSGTPEVTAFDETDSGKALVVDVDSNRCEVEPVSIGRWHFVQHRLDVTGADGVEGLREWLNHLSDKAETVVRLNLFGTLSVQENAHMAEILKHFGDVLAGLEVMDDGRHVAILFSDEDFDQLNFGGFVSSAVQELREQARGSDDSAQTAQEALKLLFRLGREGRQ